MNDADDEGFCQRHWNLMQGPLRANYYAAWTEAVAMERAGLTVDPAPFQRVTKAWSILKEEAIRRFA